MIGRLMRGLGLTLALVAALAVMAVPASAAGAVPSAIWADGNIYGTVATPTSLPNQGPFDTIYSFGMSSLSGQRSISEAKPGDQDFNGGRWEVHNVYYTTAGEAYFDQNGDGRVDAGKELKSDSALMWAVSAGLVTIDQSVATRFVCPLLPGKTS